MRKDGELLKLNLSELKEMGSGPQEEPERRSARTTDAGATRYAISQLNVGGGPKEEASRRLARTTDFGKTKDDIQRLSFTSPGKFEVDTAKEHGDQSHVAFKDVKSPPKLKAAGEPKRGPKPIDTGKLILTVSLMLSTSLFTDVKFSPHPQPSFHVPPEETLLPEVMPLDKFINNGWIDSGGEEAIGARAEIGRVRPGTAPVASIVRFPGAFDFETSAAENNETAKHSYVYGTNNYDSSDNLFVNIPERPKSRGRGETERGTKNGGAKRWQHTSW